MKRLKEDDLYVIRGRRPRTGVARASRPAVIHWLVWGGLITALVVVGLLIAIALLAPPLTDREDDLTPEEGAETMVSDLPAGSLSEGEPLILAHNRIDLEPEFKAFVSEYERETGVQLDVRLISGSEGYLDYLDQAAGQNDMPDLFLLEQPSDFEQFESRLADLGTEPWAKDNPFIFTQNGKIIGFPLDLQATGLIFNRDLLERAGIDPTSLTQIDGWKAALQTIDRRKKQLGITSAISLSLSEQTGMARSNTLDLFNIYLGSGLNYNNMQMAAKLQSNEVELPRFQQFVDYLDLLFFYSDPEILATGTYADQQAAFVSGKTVFMLASNWVDAELAGDSVDFTYGFVPYGAYQPPTNGIFVTPVSYLAVNGDSPKQEAARQVLTYLASSMANQQILADLPGAVSAFSSGTSSIEHSLTNDLVTWIQSGHVYGRNQNQMTDAIASEILIPLCRQLAEKSITSNQFTEQFSKQIASSDAQSMY